MIGERKLIALLLALGVFSLSLYNSLQLSLESFLLETTVLLFASLLALGGFAAHAFSKTRLAWKLLTVFFSIALLNTVGLFYVAPHVSIILLAIFSCAGYILVLDAIHEGKMILSELSLDTKKTLGVLDEKRSDVLQRLGRFHRSFSQWEPSHTPYGEVEETKASPIEEISLAQYQPEKKFLAAHNAQRFHLPSCVWVKDLASADVCEFNSEHEAFEKGLYPCDCVSSK